MYFGGMNGINSFRPQDLFQPGLNPPMILMRFMQYNQQLDSPIDIQLNDNLGRTTEISPNISYFQVDWTLPNYFNPDKNQYFTWMEGLEEGWSLLGNTPSIRFNKLPAGNYTLRGRKY